MPWVSSWKWQAGLIEIKSRMVLPQTEESADEVEDPRQDLVQHLLEYKQYRDAASLLAETESAMAKPFFAGCRRVATSST